MTEVTAVYYEPRDRFIPFHQRNQRWSCIVAHRRAGKTVACVAELVTRALYTPKKSARYGYIAPFYRQAKEIAWRYAKEMTKDSAAKVYESTLTIEMLNGSLIQLFGADNPDALRGLYFDGVVLDEYGDMRPSLWAEVIRPTLADRRGWAVFIGTPKGENHFHDIYKLAATDTDWFCLTLRASESDILPQEELDDMRAQMSEEQYSREMECSFQAPVVGTYYASLICKLEAMGRVDAEAARHDPKQPVHVASDLGFSDSSAFWFWQERPDGLAIIDYEEDASKPLDHYFDMLDSKPYDYGTFWLPHDARAKTLQTGRSTIEQFIAHFGAKDVQIVPRLKIQDGIDAVRAMLPMCAFAPEARNGVYCLKEYRRQWDETKKVFREIPFHNWASHGADAFRGLALVAKQRRTAQKAAQPSRTPGGFTLDMLFKDREIDLSRRRAIP